MGTCCETICKHRIPFPSIRHFSVIVPGASPGETKMWAAVRENGDFFALTVRITGKLLKIDGYMLRGVWQALNCLFIRATFCVIATGASPGQTKNEGIAAVGLVTYYWLTQHTLPNEEAQGLLLCFRSVPTVFNTSFRMILSDLESDLSKYSMTRSFARSLRQLSFLWFLSDCPHVRISSIELQCTYMACCVATVAYVALAELHGHCSLQITRITLFACQLLAPSGEWVNFPYFACRMSKYRH